MATLDPALQERVRRAAEKFDAAFEAVVARPGAPAYDQLREATDRLMRAAGRVLIEIERNVEN